MIPRTLTVAELIEELQRHEPDALVLMQADYGDYHHTQQALTIETVETGTIVHEPGYSRSGFAVLEEDDDPCEDGCGHELCQQKFVILH